MKNYNKEVEEWLDENEEVHQYTMTIALNSGSCGYFKNHFKKRSVMSHDWVIYHKAFDEKFYQCRKCNLFICIGAIGVSYHKAHSDGKINEDNFQNLSCPISKREYEIKNILE